MTSMLYMTWLTIAAVALGADGGERPKTDTGDKDAEDKKVQAVIKQVEKECVTPPYVYTIGRKRAERLAELVRRQKPRLVVECGTALGYSGLWIARELKKAGPIAGKPGRLITIELSAERVKKARASFRKAGLQEYVTVKQGDARQVVKEIEGPIDFVFIDCGYSNYMPCLKGLQDQLSSGATIVADNVGVGAGGMKDYLKEVRSKYTSRTEWFDVNLPWGKRDAMEISVVPK